MEDNTTPSEELVTEVTSIAQEELKTGVKIETPNAEDLANRAGLAFIRNRKMFNEIFGKLSTRGKIRVMNAVLDLPADGVPVYLRGDEEKLGFAVGQRVISDRFIITQHHIVKEVQAQRATEAEAKLEKEAEEKVLDNSENKS